VSELNYIILDVEYIQQKQSPITEIIQIGAVKIDDKTFEFKSYFNQYVRPITKYGGYAEKITRIDKSILLKSNRFPYALNNFLDWINLNEEYVLVSWSPSDYNALLENCLFYNLNVRWLNKYLDLQKAYMEFFNLDRCIGLDDALSHFEIPDTYKRHNALGDALNLGEIFKKLYQMVDIDRYIQNIEYIPQNKLIRIKKGKLALNKFANKIIREIIKEQLKGEYRKIKWEEFCLSKEFDEFISKYKPDEITLELIKEAYYSNLGNVLEEIKLQK
jgi:inhibitor of KinA sporulation pathway (predicted exonuclease)